MTERNRITKIAVEVIAAIWLIVSLTINSSTAIISYIVLIVVYLAGRDDYISPIIYLLVPWSFMLTMFFSSTIVYTQKSSEIAPIIFIVLCLTLITFGHKIGNKLVIKKKRSTTVYSNECYTENHTHSKNIIIIITIMCAVSIVGSILGIYDLLFISGINTSSLMLMRESYVARESNIISQISNITSWASLVVVPALFYLGKKANILQKILWWFSLILCIAQSMLSAGRQIVFSIAIMLIISYAIKMYIHPRKERKVNRRVRKDTKKYKRFIVILGALAITYMMFIATSRTNQDISNTKIGVLQFYFGFNLCDWLSRFISIIPSGIADGLVEGLVYFTHQIGEFTVFWGIPIIGPFFGLYSIPFLDRRLSFLNQTYTMDEKMKYVRYHMQSQGVMPVGWRTAISYYIFDFGKIGCLLFCFVLGIIAKKVCIRFKKNRTFFSALELIMIVIYMFYTVMMPATCETSLLFMIVFAFVMGRLENRYSWLRYTIE